MSDIIGFIESIENGFVSGWIAHDKLSSPPYLYCNEDIITKISNFHFREDIQSAGISDTDAGFKIDIKEFFRKISGGKKIFSIRSDNELIFKKETFIKSNENLIVNPFLNFDHSTDIQNTRIIADHRLGLLIDSFISPKSLEFTNGTYTRISLAEKSATGKVINLNIDTKKITKNVELDEYIQLDFLIVSRCSTPVNILIQWIDKYHNILSSEPIFIDREWSYKTLPINKSLVETISVEDAKLNIIFSHQGQSYLDIAMLGLAENIRCIEINETKKSEISHSLDRINLLKNGEFSEWSNGIKFPTLKRGQELADHWFIEMSKENQSNIFCTVETDTYQIDPLIFTQPKLALRLRTRELKGYARLISPIDTRNLYPNSYKLEIEVEASGLKTSSSLKKIYFIARNSEVDRVVLDISKKISIPSRKKVTINITQEQITSLIGNTGNLPVVVLAIELSEESDIKLFDIKLTLTQNEMEAYNKPLPISLGKPNSLNFEDSNISAQQGKVKGIEFLNSEKSLSSINITDILKSLNSTEHFINQLNKINLPKIKRLHKHYPNIDIVIPIYNACDDVYLCIQSVLEKTDIPYTLILIDDYSDERTANMIAAVDQKFQHVQTLRNKKNIGYTKSVNIGIKESKADWIVILNSDTIVSKGWLPKLLDCAVSKEYVGMVGPLSNAASWQSIPEIFTSNGDWNLNPLPINFDVDKMAALVEKCSLKDYPEVKIINGFCQLINMEMLEKIGLLDEIAFPKGYGEENDMCIRAISSNFKILIADDTYVYHAKSKSFGHETRKELSKQGSQALSKKHPQINWPELTSEIKNHPALIELRTNLTNELLKITENDL